MRQKNCLGYPGLSWEGRDPTGTPAESYERARSEDTHLGVQRQCAPGDINYRRVTAPIPVGICVENRTYVDLEGGTEWNI